MGHFKVKSKKKLDKLKVGDIINESDYATITPEGNFVQLEYIENEIEQKPYQVKPGIWTLKKSVTGFDLIKTSFVADSILESFVHTKDVEDKIDCFFKKLDVYYKFGFEVPKRGILLFGPPGTGKTTIINKIGSKYNKDKKTAIVVWNTDKFEAFEVKDFIKSFEYKGVDKLILIAEDIGGVEIDQTRIRSESSLLSLLDNQEKTFTIPVLILATTNYPEVFMGNLTNRPNRFDDKIEVGFPDGEDRAELLEFFAKEKVAKKCKDEIKKSGYSEFSPAHIREVIIRSAIYDKDMLETLQDIRKEIEFYKKAFTKTNSMGVSAW